MGELGWRSGGEDWTVMMVVNEEELDRCESLGWLMLARFLLVAGLELGAGGIARCGADLPICNWLGYY